MDRRRRILWRRLAKIWGRIKTASSIHKLAKLLQDKQDLEQQLFDDYSATNILEENQAISNIKSNPKAFFSFARSRQKTCAELVHLLIQTLANQTLVQSLQPQPLANNTAQFLFSQEISGRSRIQKSSLKHCLKVLLWQTLLSLRKTLRKPVQSWKLPHRQVLMESQHPCWKLAERNSPDLSSSCGEPLWTKAPSPQTCSLSWSVLYIKEGVEE